MEPELDISRFQAMEVYARGVATGGGYRQCRIKVGAIDAAALGPLGK